MLKRETLSPRVGFTYSVGGGSRGWGERNLERSGGRGEKGWICTLKSFFSVRVERTRQDKAWQGKARQMPYPPTHAQNPRVTKVHKTVLAKRNKEGALDYV
jgi:hypothetical protein